MAIAAKGAGKGAKGGKGGKGRGRGGGGGLTIPQLALQQSQQQVSASEQPILDQIAQEKAANLARAQAQIGFSKAAAALMQNAAPAVQSAYTNAANADAGYAKGLGSGVQSQLDQSQNANNAFLSKMGTPQSALHAAPSVGDVAYGLQGYIPASTLQQEGAGWESQAQLAPGNLLAAGQQQAAGMMNPANDATLKTLNEDLAKLAATQPEVYQKLLTAYNTELYHQQQLAQGQQRIGISQQNANTSLYRANTAAQQGQIRLQQGAQRIGLEAQRMANQNQQAWARIGIAKGNLRLRAATEEAKLQASQATGGTAGFTPSELVHIKNTAANMAISLYNGSTGWPKNASYKYGMKYMVTHGIPPSIADRELRAAGYRPGDGRGTPKANPFANIGGGPNGTPFGIAGIKDPVERQAAGTIVQQAYQYLGTPYVWGGESPKGFDCSGFAQYLYRQAGINIPRTTYTQWQTGFSVGKGQLQPGDLVFFRGGDSRGGLPGHVGIYIGGGKMIDAPHTGASVRVESVNSFGGYMGARRYR